MPVASAALAVRASKCRTLLKQRVITGLLLLFILGGSALLLPAGPFNVLAAAIFLLASWEWANLCGFTELPAKLAYLALFALLLVLLGLYCGAFGVWDAVRTRQMLGAACVWWAVALLWIQSYPASAQLWGSQPVRALMGVLVLAPAWLGVAYLRGIGYGIGLILYLAAVVAAADIGAYFAGRAFGKRKLAARVSPGKSWAGLVGGLVSALLLATVVGSFQPWAAMSMLTLAAISVLTALASVLGDLLESMLKRHRGVKDSGTALPGHGGVLDRLDSLTAAAPIFALCAILTDW